MRVIKDLSQLDEPLVRTVLTIGNFDGIHLGHREIFRRVVNKANELDGTSVVVTFEPHPLRLLAPQKAPLRLNTPEEKVRLIGASCIDILVVLPFDRQLAEMSAEAFVRDILVGKLGEKFPMQMIWLIVVTALIWVLLNRHKFGAHIYLIGDNVNSAELMGINTGRTRIMGFILVGLVSAFAGVVASLHVTYFWPSLGEGYLLRTLASVFLGGTSVFGGVGTIFGTFIGAFIIGAIEAATVAIGLTGFWTQLIYGLIIVLSVIMHTYLRKKME